MAGNAGVPDDGAALGAVGILICMTAKMHADELELDEPLVRRLLADQFPDWGNLPLSRSEPSGTDHAIFRLGEELAVRLARLDGAPRARR